MNTNQTQAYMQSLSPLQRNALLQLKALIMEAAPQAEEHFAYQMPAFKLNKLLVCYAAFKNHYSLFPCSAATLAKFTEELKEYKTSKGTVQFKYDQELPQDLIKKIIQLRVQDNLLK
jgi:uncharacterized protein YdhG (YjbR/CyaY superfamily)